MRPFTFVGILLPLIVPPVAFFFCSLAAGMAIPETLAAVGEQYATRRQNLLLSALPGFFPVMLLHLVLFIMRRRHVPSPTRQRMAWTGLATIAAVLIWVNLQFWPLFLPDRVYPGFPHGLEFIIGPFLFAPGLMLVTLASTWMINRRG